MAGLLACLALALAYLPPRGVTSSGPRDVFRAQSPQGTPARRRAQALAEEWRASDGALRLLRTRRQLQERVRRAADTGSSLVVFTESAGRSEAVAQRVDSAMRVAWRRLGLGETKVRVAAVIELAASSAGRDRPVPETGLTAYLAPDSTDRTTCIAVVPIGRYWSQAISRDVGRPAPAPFEALVQSFKAGLGPCAFYAAYGTPGKPVRRWLAKRGWDLGLNLDPGARGVQQGSLIGTADPRHPWFWDAIYSLPPAAVGCLASRPEACRVAVLDGVSDDFAIRVPDVMRIDRRWWRTQRLVEAPRFLGDVAHDVGRDRFMTFWTSTLPVETALAAALKRPVGDWTAEWQRDFVKPIRLGPTPPFGGFAIALAIAAFAVALVSLTVARRQVR